MKFVIVRAGDHINPPTAITHAAAVSSLCNLQSVTLLLRLRSSRNHKQKALGINPAASFQPQ